MSCKEVFLLGIPGSPTAIQPLVSRAEWVSASHSLAVASVKTLLANPSQRCAVLSLVLDLYLETTELRQRRHAYFSRVPLVLPARASLEIVADLLPSEFLIRDSCEVGFLAEDRAVFSMVKRGDGLDLRLEVWIEGEIVSRLELAGLAGREMA
jgi:hypothetical protein